MRSDSTRLSDVFVKSAFAFIDEKYGKEYVRYVHQKNNENVSRMPMEAIGLININNTNGPESIKDVFDANDQI